MRNIFRRKKKVTSEAEIPEKKVEAVGDEKPDKKKVGWFDRLKTGLSKTRKNFVGQLQKLLQSGRKIDEELMEELEEILICADVGIYTTQELMANVRSAIEQNNLKDASLLEPLVRSEILSILGEENNPLRIDREIEKPYTILVLGVNGAGKTTTIGKLAHRFNSEGLKVLIAAGDTFRAAAAEQLEIWCKRSGAELLRGKEGGDPAAVVFDAIEAGKARGIDVVIVDTAGRLHTKKPLMAQLTKIGRVMERALPASPHEVLLVVDGTAGQNAIMQAKTFNSAVPITGVAITKLDGTAKGGIVVAVRKELDVPVKLIGIGEKLDDLRDFVAEDFIAALFQREVSDDQTEMKS